MSAGLVVVPCADGAEVRLQDPVLWFGEAADENLIATIACRHRLRRRHVVDEQRVQQLVEKEGFLYMPPNGEGVVATP